MSTAEILSLISVISFVFCAISFVLAVFFWFFFKIPSVIGDLSGRTARKSIEKMRAGNEKTAAQGYRPKTNYTTRNQPAPAILQSPKPVTVKPQPPKPTTAGLKKKFEKPAMPVKMPGINLVDEGATPTEEILVTEPLEATVALTEEILVTEPLNDTYALAEEIQPTELLADTAVTEPLMDEETTLLPTGGVTMTTLDDVMLIHTDEQIP